MIQIPKQLLNCKFIKTKDKFPYENGWTTINNYAFDNFFTQDDTYGVATGFNKVVVVDVDKKYIQDKLLELEQFRQTFTVRTATKQLNHFYFLTDVDNPKSFSLNNNDNERIIDLQASGKMVVGPNSKLSSGNTYDVVNDSNILFIPYNFLKNILINIDDNIKIFSKEDKSDIKEVFFDFDQTCTKIKSLLTIKDVLSKITKIDTTQIGNTMCPLGHTSEGGKCFSFTKNVWYCFHCYQTGNIFHLYQKIKKINFVDAKRQLSEMAGINNETNTKILLNYAEPKNRHLASELLAKEFMKLYKVYTIREDKDTEIYIYKEGIYVPEGKSYIKEYVRSILESLYNESFVKTVIDKIIVDSYIEKDRFFVNEHLNLLPVANGVLNLETLELNDFSSEYRFFSKLPVIYDAQIKPDKTLEFIRDIVKDETDVLTIQEIGGYLLHRENKYEKAFMLLGNGRNGKSKLIELMQYVLGKYNTTELSLTSIETDQFALINLYNKYANFSPDISKEALNNTGNFKSLTGRDSLTINRKFKTSIDFTNYAKMIFAANELPQTNDMKDGFFDRWVIIDFPFKFVDEPNESYHKLKILNIIEKITTQRELTGLLNWFIEGLHRLFKNGTFTTNYSTETIKTKWISESNTFAKFWFNEIEITGDINNIITRDDMMQAYDIFCHTNNLEKESNTAIYKFANQNCIYKRIKMNGEPTNVFKKVKFKSFIPKSEELINFIK